MFGLHGYDQSMRARFGSGHGAWEDLQSDYEVVADAAYC